MLFVLSSKPSAGGSITLSKIVLCHWRDNFIIHWVDEVAQLHTLVDWMRDEDLD